MEKENKFIKGLFLNKPHENAPDFVKGDVSIKVADFIEYLKEHEKQSGFVNIQLLESQEGKLYFKLNDWTPEKKDEIGKDQIPF